MCIDFLAISIKSNLDLLKYIFRKRTRTSFHLIIFSLFFKCRNLLSPLIIVKINVFLMSTKGFEPPTVRFGTWYSVHWATCSWTLTQFIQNVKWSVKLSIHFEQKITHARLEKEFSDYYRIVKSGNPK